MLNRPLTKPPFCFLSSLDTDLGLFFHLLGPLGGGGKPFVLTRFHTYMILLLTPRNNTSCHIFNHIIDRLIGMEQNNDSRGCNNILRLISLPGNRAAFFTFWGEFLTKLHRKPGEKGKKIHWRRHHKIQRRRRPEMQISVPCRGRTRPELSFSCHYHRV